MPRRRIYILNIEDYLHEDEGPTLRERLRPFLRIAALAAGIIGNGILIACLIHALVPSDTLSVAIPVTLGYIAVLLLFIALAKRVNHS